MGNSLTTEEKAAELERTIIVESGLELVKDIVIYDVEIDYLGTKIKIHTISCGDDSKEPLVMLHGFGGSSLFYFKLLKYLSKDFKVYCIDHLGMGLSSRPDFNCKTTDETISFFVESIELWKKKVGLDKFIMCGHSFGGYMAAFYTLYFKESVKGLILLSPLGFTKDNLEWEFLESETYLDNLGFFQRFIHKRRLEFFKEKRTVAEMADTTLAKFVSPFIIPSWRKRLKLDSRVGGLLWDYLILIFKISKNSEKSLHYIINPNFIAYQPIEDIIHKIPVHTTVLYGDKDWMCSKGAKRVNNKNLKNFKLVFINDCGHQMTMENPEALAEHFTSKISIIEQYETSKENLEQIK